MTEVRGRLGRELLIIEIFGARAAGLHLVISQLTSKHLDERAPLVRFWRYQDDELVEQPDSVALDLDDVDVPEATNDACV